MELPNIEFSRFAVYTFIILAVIIFALFRILERIRPVLKISKELRRRLLQYLPGIELFIWVLYFVWAIQFFWNNNQLYSLGLFAILIVLLLWISWFALKDFIAGAIFKANRSFALHETVKIEEMSGKIVQFKNRTLVIETDAGETIHIPYSLLLGKIIIKSFPAEMILSKSITITIPKKGNLDGLIEALRTDILTLPWSSVKKDPKIRPVSETSDTVTFELLVYAMEKDAFYKIESYLKEKYGE